jgi:nitrite reductase (NADH) large subunit
MSTGGELVELVVVGNGMVGHRLLTLLANRGALGRYRVTVVCGEPRPAYDRVNLSQWFQSRDDEALAIADTGFFATHGIELMLGDPAVEIDRARRVVRSASGVELPYDRLVLATGSYPFVPPVEGRDRSGVFVYRTLEDLAAIDEWARRDETATGVVIGGGLLGLEAANALKTLGLETHVVEVAPHLMPAQLDEGGAAVLRDRIEDLGVTIHTGTATSAIAGEGDEGPVTHLEFADGERVDAQIVVFSAGIRPHDELARSSGLEVGERGGIVVDDELRTSDPDIWAIGECALHRSRIYGLVAPGYRMAEALAAQLAGDEPAPRFEGADLGTKLKLLGVDVACFGDHKGTGPGTRTLTWHDDVERIHKRLTVCEDTGRVVGGLLVGDASDHAALAAMVTGDLPTPDDVAGLIAPAGGAGTAGVGVSALADTAMVCTCESVDKGTICQAVDDGAHDVGSVKACTRAGTGCGGCVPMVTNLVNDRLRQSGVEVDDSLCEHFAYTRQQMFDLIRFHRHSSWAEVLSAHGRGRGCAICRPVVGSILASLSNGYILDGDQSTLQDSNDHVLANIQRNGSYSVVPRVPGGEITPDQLIALGEIARDFDLYTKITGGQRIDLFGARLEDLPAIWARVIDAGMESGHAYGKALRTVKSCVGLTWCRYGVQDSTSMAIRLEERYRGLRSPHKLKSAVSGCTRECAEAQGKDFGVIATERGWNLYVCGNGGKNPRHADLLATDLDDETLIRYIDRFLMFYIRTADRLERTSVWLEKMDGGIDYLKQVVVDDSLGIAAELEADLARHVETYECEWKATLDDPERLARFVTFVNEPGRSDPEIVFVRERGQPRPARNGELDKELELVR